jgi:hypothetical protein
VRIGLAEISSPKIYGEKIMMMCLNLQVNRPAARISRITVVSGHAAAFGTIAVASRLPAPIGFLARVDRALKDRLGGLNLGLRQCFRDCILRQGVGQWDGGHRRNLHTKPQMNLMKLGPLWPEWNEEVLNHLVANISLEKGPERLGFSYHPQLESVTS